MAGAGFAATDVALRGFAAVVPVLRVPVVRALPGLLLRPVVLFCAPVDAVVLLRVLMSASIVAHWPTVYCN